MNEETPIKHTFDDPEPPERPKKAPISIKRSLVYTGIIVVIIIMGFTVIMAKLINENSQCTSNPFVYGAAKIESSRGNPDPICQCNVDDKIFCVCAMTNNGAFWFDDEKIYAKNPLLNPQQTIIYP